MIKVEICKEEITISMNNSIEIVHWVEDEWNEDPSIVVEIANAIHLAYTEPDKLIEINQKHIDSQINM